MSHFYDIMRITQIRFQNDSYFHSSASPLSRKSKPYGFAMLRHCVQRASSRFFPLLERKKWCGWTQVVYLYLIIKTFYRADIQTIERNLYPGFGNKFKMSTYEWYKFWGLDRCMRAKIKYSQFHHILFPNFFYIQLLYFYLLLMYNDSTAKRYHKMVKV